MENTSQVPVTVLTGFLGAGKTTLLNRILTEQHGRKYAVIVNEFGEQGIDNDLVVDADEEVFEMNNGCICCTVRGDLIRILSGLMKRADKLDAIIVETTGLADPAPVAQTFFVDQDVADVLAREGFSSVDEVAYCSMEEFNSIEDFDEELIQELRKRAIEKIEAKNKKLEEENSLSGIKELNKNHIDLLIKNNINNKEDLADLSVDELLEMIELSKEDAGKIIMDAREPWFNQD